MNEAVQRRNRGVLLAIAALFFIPLLLAMLMQSRWWQFETEGTTNQGDLLDPPVIIEATALEPASLESIGGRWQMAYVLEPQCATVCQRAVTGLRQVHTAAGRHQDTVAVTLYAPGGLSDEQRTLLEGISDRFVLVADPWSRAADAFHTAANQVWPNGGGAIGAAFLIDPRGHIILAYAPGFDPNDIHKDLKKLLKWSSQD